MVCGCGQFIDPPQVGVTCGNVSAGVSCGRLRGMTMRIFCVTYEVGGVCCEMCYPAMDSQQAIKLCEEDFPHSRYYVAQEVE